ncbi:MAG TPA: glycosyltransferase family 4 protein [Methylomirabilota bacterium]|jgi:glycosyltransferase involved in cell wall biosynthesis|nr:glycosyltransferase family 4 protein [Methylomirabilota bacterium]
MKAVLHTESSPGLGGQEIRTLNEARWTVERGWRVILACPPDGRLYDRAREAGLEPVAVPMKAAWDARAALQLRRLIKREQVSIVHTHSSVDAWLGGAAARAAGVPVVRTRHVSLPIRRGWNPVYTRLADRVITSGEAIRRMVVAAGVAPPRVVAIPAGVDLDGFPFRVRSDGDAESIGMSSPVIGSVAMFRGSKGHDHLIEAFRLIRATHPRATLLLVGDGIRRGWVEGLAREAGLERAVVFTGFRSDVAALLSVMDCFVLASTRTEGIPQSLLQAFAAGVPVVASEVGGVPEVVVDGVTGVLVKPESPTELSRGIEAVLGDQPGAERRADAARRLVEDRFSHRAIMTRLLDVYDQLLGGLESAPVIP